MKTYVRVFVALSLGVAFSVVTRTQDSGKTLGETYKDETHCLVGPEIRNEKDKSISCYCRDALMDARYVYQTYLLSGKDRNLNGTYLTLEGNASQMCGEGYDVHRTAQDADWRWNGPEVTRKHPGDSGVHQREPDPAWFVESYERGFITVRHRGYTYKATCETSRSFNNAASITDKNNVVWFPTCDLAIGLVGHIVQPLESSHKDTDGNTIVMWSVGSVLALRRWRDEQTPWRLDEFKITSVKPSVDKPPKGDK